MHIPLKFKETDVAQLASFIQTYPLGTLITANGSMSDADHIPFFLSETGSDELVLQSHIAKANPLWKNSAEGQNVLIIFHGPSGYVSPNYYPSKLATGKAVPTWNYAVVHVRGRIHFKQEPEWILQLLNNISDQQESEQTHPWKVSDAPTDYITKLTHAVMGIEIEVEDIVGNMKLSQDKSAPDFEGVVQGLNASPRAQDRLLCEHMEHVKNT